VYISIAWSCIPQLLKFGAKQDLQKVYGPMLQATPEPNFDITLKVDLDNPTENPGTIFSAFFSKDFFRSFFIS
jgi:hypothetical protein